MSPLLELIELEHEAREFGFDWPNQQMILDQVVDECREIREELAKGGDQEKLQEEIGDLLQSVLSLCLFSGFDVEETIIKTHCKFSKRMSLLKLQAQEHGLMHLRGQTMDFMLKLWDEAKKRDEAEKLALRKEN